jgi:hypothetical protein
MVREQALAGQAPVLSSTLVMFGPEAFGSSAAQSDGIGIASFHPLSSPPIVSRSCTVSGEARTPLKVHSNEWASKDTHSHPILTLSPLTR